METKKRHRSAMLGGAGETILTQSVKALPASQLRWICEPESLGFDTTAEVEPIYAIIGQPLALEAMHFGLACDAPGQNIFVRGLRGTGRLTMVQRMLQELNPHCREKRDRCYVHNFLQPDRPRLISLPLGQARQLRRRLSRLADFVAGQLVDAMNDDALKTARANVQAETQRQVENLSAPFEADLKAQGLTLVQLKTPQGPQSTVFPLHEGKALAPEQLEQLVKEGKVSADQRDAILKRAEKANRRIPELAQAVARMLDDSAKRIDAFNERHLRQMLANMTAAIRADFEDPTLAIFLDELVDDVVDNNLRDNAQGYDPKQRYGINILLEQQNEGDSPIVLENSPSLTNLLGTIETQWEASGQAISDYRSVRGGSLLRADGGYLILDAHDVVAEPGAWKILMRTLRTGTLEIVPAEFNSPFAPAVSLKPEPIPVRIRVILLGTSGLYYQLDELDYDFSDQFKVLADFDDYIERSADAVRQYAGVLARIRAEEGLLHFTACGVSALAEHGCRVAGKGGRMTTRIGRIADIAREACWVAKGAGCDIATGDHVRAAVKRTKSRASLPSLRFQSFLKDGTIQIDTQGSVVGQINGLAVISAGLLTYGFPARITASIGAGHAGVIDVESRAAMSGSIHTKGFHILGGLLRHLLKTDHPLAFSASIAFEQTYGGIDGDSASGAEICCLLSALTGVPIRQDLAITGAIDQHGHLQAIGGVNEKIEGFYDICAHFGLSGQQGVIIPLANRGDLMLRHDVVETARAGRFHIYAAATIQDVLHLLTGVAAGEWDGHGYPDDSLLGQARAKARQYWEETVRAPRPLDGDAIRSDDDNEEGDR